MGNWEAQAFASCCPGLSSAGNSMTSKRIVIVDDEPNIGLSLQLILEREGYSVLIHHSAAEFRARMATERADLCMLDVRLPDGNGIDLLRLLRQSDNRVPVVMISGHGTISDAVEATRAGAFDFLEKPLSRDKVLLAGEERARAGQPAAGERAAARAGGHVAEDDRQHHGVA